ncbi:MAG: sugar-transfer associated ATP-grasp domain-containing protein [Erysipelotrichaceae bacterium]|nr:sugar-transfer associated ATP-grasp domain-containing protein [Erysipelotrichaceae bacterium]
MKKKYFEQLEYAERFIKFHNVKINKDSKTIAKEMVDAKVRYGMAFEEFFQFHFEGKNDDYKSQFVGDNERLKRFTEKLNEKPDLFWNEYKTYEYFKPYYKRDVCCLNNEIEQEKNLYSFFEKHKCFVVKPIDASQGNGVNKYDISNMELYQVINMIKNDYSDKPVIIEELISQDEELSRLHPQSVNTVRIVTFNFGDHIECRYPCLRMGVGDSIVDNGAAGGIFAAVDVNTGKLLKVADELGHEYAEHPDTKVDFRNYVIPKWNEVKSLGIKLAKLIPENRYCSWDFALQNGEWILIEVNSSGHLLWQIAMNQGLRTDLKNIVKKMKTNQIQHK